jgi:LuxR family maltose regulon positive regulatory protein
MEVPTLTYAEIQFYQQSQSQDQKASISYIQQALEQARQHGNLRQVIRLSILRAMAQWEAGQRETGLAALEQTLRQAEPKGLVRTFVDRGPRLQKMLHMLLEQNPDHHYAARLLAAFPAAPGAPLEPRASVIASTYPGRQSRVAPWLLRNGEMLTNRELDVLLLLRQRFSNKEIASQLFVSPETVRKHAASIYRKLGVRGRRQAVESAVRQGLIT